MKLFNKVIMFFFGTYIIRKRIEKEKQEAFLKKYPCPSCRPDSCTFYYDIPCVCEKCGRRYSI